MHTAKVKTPSQLDWFLDLVAQAREDGPVRVLASSEQVFFGKNQ